MKSSEAVKPSLVPSGGHAKGKDTDGDEPVAAPAPVKVGFLPTGLSRAMVIGSLLLVSAVIAVGLFGDRYTLVSALRSENAVIYRLDRLTGQISFCSPVACVPVAEKAPTAN